MSLHCGGHGTPRCHCTVHASFSNEKSKKAQATPKVTLEGKGKGMWKFCKIFSFFLDVKYFGLSLLSCVFMCLLQWVVL